MAGVDPLAVADEASRLLAAHHADTGRQCDVPCRDPALGPLHETVRAGLGTAVDGRSGHHRAALASLCSADPAYAASLARAVEHMRAAERGGVANTVVSASSAHSTVVQSGTAANVHLGDTHDRRGLYALLTVIVLLVVSTAVVAVLIADGQDTSAPASASPPLGAASNLRLKKDCASGWIVPDTTRPVPYSARPVDAVLGTGGEVVVTVQGTTGRSVVLQSARVEVLGRSPARAGAYLPSSCQAVQAQRYFRVDLDQPVPELVPVSHDGPVVTFPFRVSDTEPELFVITAMSPGAEVEWRLHISWTAGAEEGELVVDDGGKPFRTTDITAARPLCLAKGGAQWREPPC